MWGMPVARIATIAGLAFGLAFVAALLLVLFPLPAERLVARAVERGASAAQVMRYRKRAAAARARAEAVDRAIQIDGEDEEAAGAT